MCSPIAPKQTFTCFSCNQQAEKPFAKINRGELQYVTCDSKCLSVALSRLCIIVEGTRDFTSPVTITVRNSPFMSVNTSKSPLQRSPGSMVLNAVGEASESESERDTSPVGGAQLKKLGESRGFNS